MSGWEISLEPEPFAEGRFRYAFKGHYTKHPTKQGQRIVDKKFKNSYCLEKMVGMRP